MGEASRAKKARREQLRSRPELLRNLAQQHQILVRLGKVFDDGVAVASLPLSVAVRVLVHDTSRSHALLVQLNERTRMRFIDSALPMSPTNLMTAHNGLVILKMTAGSGSSWAPRVEVGASPAVAGNQPLPFDTWWRRAVVVRDTRLAAWTRERLVLDIANKEGGAHIDPMRPEDLKALEDDNSMGWTHSDPLAGADQPMLNGPLLPSVRQIAHELQLSLEEHLADHLYPA